MILSRDQILRYMRHIAIPDISGQGQKKILESSVILYAESLEKASLALYYLAASGVGEVSCHINNVLNWKEYKNKLSDLNSDSKISLHDEEAIRNPKVQNTTRIITGSFGYVGKIVKDIIENDYYEYFIPTVVSICNGWCGAVQTFTEKNGLEEFLSEMYKSAGYNSQSNSDYSHKPPGYFSSLMAVIEHLKLTLSLGKPLSRPLQYDLSVLEFDSVDSLSDLIYKLESPEIPESLPETLANSKVLIAGCGGLGSSAAYTLAASGIGRLGLVDYNTVELSNLNRQIMHSSSRIGMPKVKSSEIFLRQINPNIMLDMYNSKIDRENVQDIIGPYDVVIGCLDNRPDRYVLNDACIAAGKPLLEAGALDISGLATSIIPGEGHCYRCVFPESKDKNPMPSCSETGVLGPVPGLMGIVQASEAIKLLDGIGIPLKNKLLLFDVFDTDIYIADNRRNKNCELCSK